MATLLWVQLRLDEFWLAALPPSREGTSWLNILKTLVGYQLISPGSEWRLHHHWFEHSAMGNLLGEDIALVQPNNLYRCWTSSPRTSKRCSRSWKGAGKTRSRPISSFRRSWI